ncbi:MAG: GH92 family glycosyl hydrolase [Aestuariibaculum sp.]
MKKNLIFLFLVGQIILAQNYSQYVNPFIGTGGAGHTFPGATTPFGMVQLSPDTRIDGRWEGCAGYHYTDSIIYGFSHTHLNGTGISDYGDILLAPTMGKPSFNSTEYASPFSHDNESASAGFYSVKLDKHDIDVRLTTSTRVGFHEYTFNKSGIANIILDMNHRDELLEGEIRIIDNKTIDIFRRSKAWATNQYIYARLTFNVPMSINLTKANGTIQNDFYSGTELALSFSKPVLKGEKILVKVALSPTSYKGAKLNAGEIEHWNFEKTRKNAIALWNKELSKIEVTSNNKEKLTIFYTALYHTMMQPNIAQDLDGKYRGRDNNIHQSDGFDYYTVFSLWDTFRAAHPLYTLIDKKRTSNYINTFIKQYEQGGRLPVWELASNETDCMIGYHSVSVIADAMVKGIKGFDYKKAFEASKASAMRDVLGLKAVKENGFISIDDDHGSVSKTLEYAYDDWCIAQMALLLNETEDYDYFMKRSQNWKNLFDWETGFIRPKKNAGWNEPFNPKEINGNYTEGNAWQYTFFVPHDIHGMISAYGGSEKFEAKLDNMFNSESKTVGIDQADVTGLIGQYAHGNEPSHHMAYLYNYVNKPEKTKERVRFILDEFYKNEPDGLIGNEDCGQMSAWYVLSAMGMYSVTPADKAVWSFTSPYFDSIKVNLENGVSQTITKTNDARLHFENVNHNAARTVPHYTDMVIVPVIKAQSKTFEGSIPISFVTPYKNTNVYYNINNSVFKKYNGQFLLDETAQIQFFSNDGNGRISDTLTAEFAKKPNNYTIAIASTYNPMYHAGGPQGLIDGIYGDKNWRKGDWQGYDKQDFEAVVDLQKKKKISTLNAHFLQDTEGWIIMPKQVEFYVSNDNKSFKKIATVQNKINPKNYGAFLQDFKANVKTKARYVKVVARNFGKLPEWHQGYPFNGSAFIFIDEIEVE